ncbi:MAG TPA: FAD-linked oxidase C-terminal domain-containing protein, partial [Chloroflexota bacterium]|nr:FAD-linked oxidase C-terminal domain-containing protein [Chloroflexota bacterium]
QRLPEMITRARSIATGRGFDVATVAHAGDGNLHPALMYEAQDEDAMLATDDAITEAALELGGTLTGEHGVGLLKQRWLAMVAGPVAAEVQRGIKAVFDPLGILNPGKAI